MDCDELVLVTGATGFVGREVVRELLRSQPGARLALLIRPRAGESPTGRAASLVRGDSLERLEVHTGDVGEPDCGLARDRWRDLAARVTRIVHTAASVRFDLPLAAARDINVEGTRRILDLAAAAPNLRGVTYVGTAFVAGEREGLVGEGELPVGQAYRNTYERTKAEAEALVRSRWADLPVTILRPSIIVGDSRTGTTSSFKALYWPLKIYSRRLWRTVPGYPDAVLDMVPVDFVARAVAHLAFDPAAVGEAVHLCAGPGASTTIQDVARRAAEHFGVREPRYVDPTFFFAAIRPVLLLLLWGRRRRVLRDGRAYRGYFTVRTQFDTRNAERLLGPAGITPPPVLDYLDRLFRYCVATDWGRHPAEVA